MANSVKGEVDFMAGGRKYIFRLGINAQVMIEARVGMPVNKYVQEKGDAMGATDIRLLFYAGLQHHHPEVSEEYAGNIIDEIGAAEAAQIFIEAAMLSAPKSSDDLPGVPQKSARERIGMNS